ncbi:helix-turn-helix domain-containing protein [Sporomusa aerivorans]|uniref:helix-turn-helix domain-containing protein n=1 Tax=Sporomusa aerivorans TaxID=204936 RepID=UPI00352BB2D7
MQTVGELLRAERLKKGLSIKDVESSISIRALYLNAIEEGNFGIIPGEVYLKGFIRNYATFLGLDPQAILEIYRQGKGQAAESVAEPEKSEAKPVKPSQSGGGLLKWTSGAIILAGIVAGIVWWSTGNQKPDVAPPPPAAQQQQTGTKQPPTPPAAPNSPSASQNQSAAQSKPVAKVTVTAKYNSQCWTQILADGKEVYEGIPKSGETLTWEAANQLTAKFGNAGAVDLVYNGNAVGKIGGNGDVVTKTFTLTGITQ